MRAASCKAVCREIEEADHGQNLAASAMEHLKGCAQCQRFFDERQKLRQLVASLETVSAPADFDLRVRSRLARQRAEAGSGSFFSNSRFGVPSAAFATLVLVMGGLFAFRIWNAPSSDIAVKTETPPVSATNVQSKPTESALQPHDETQVLTAAKSESSEAIRRDPRPKSKNRLKAAVASRNDRRFVTREFSSTGAPVVKKEEAVASLESAPIFPIETSSQPLRLSLDYSGGVSRTISVPALSFGSEKVLSGDGLSLVKNSPKGVW